MVPSKGLSLLWTFDIKDVSEHAFEIVRRDRHAEIVISPYRQDELYDLAWSYDDANHQPEPVIAAAGATGLVYILSPGEKRMRRVLKGHGGVSRVRGMNVDWR